MQEKLGLSKKLIVFVLLIACAAAFAAWYFWNNNQTKTQYATVEVGRGDIENLVTATGNLQPIEYVDVGAQVTGQLEELRVAVGDQVKKGDLLAKIDATVYLAKVDATRAQLRGQKASLKDRQSQLKLAELVYQREKNLLGNDAVSREDFERAEASLRSAQAQIENVEAQIEQTESSLREQEANLMYSNIYAPIDGTVVSLSARQGQTLNANQTTPTILRLADLSVMKVKAQVSEADVSKLKLKMPVYFTILGGEGKRWYSELGRIEPTPEISNNVVLYNALFDAPNDDGALMIEMTTQVFFVTSQSKDTLRLPVTAVKMAQAGGRGKRTNKGTVQVLTSKGTLLEKEVELGVSNRVHIEVLSGLKEGDKVIANPTGNELGANANRAGGSRPGANFGGPRLN